MTISLVVLLPEASLAAAEVAVALGTTGRILIGRLEGNVLALEVVLTSDEVVLVAEVLPG